MTRGVNLPGFRATQLDFAAHVRNPDANPVPTDVESRRMAIYVELVFNNIDKFLSTTFRVTAAILGPDRWRARVRDFIDRHTSTTPFFQEIPQEFLAYLDAEGRQEDDPPFLLELAHYEWVELAVDLDDAEIESEGIDPDGDLLDDCPVVSPVAWSLAYRFAVHRISEDFQPFEEPETPTHLIVYRNRADKVKFMESNAVTARLLALLDEGHLSGREALARIAAELGSQPSDVETSGKETLDHLASCDIIVGTRRNR
jgi:hypothetical protein